MKTKRIKNLGFFLGISFFVFNNFPSLGECTLGRQAGSDVIACSCSIGNDGKSTSIVYTHLQGASREAACQKCIPGEFNFSECQPWKK